MAHIRAKRIFETANSAADSAEAVPFTKMRLFEEMFIF